MGGRIVIGTSGFAYPDWRPRFYPAGLAQTKLLPAYASRLNGVEINYTFNRFPTEKLLSGWAGKVGDEFVFCLKIPKLITHHKKLRDCGTLLGDFARTAATLAARLGPVLVQLPPTAPADEPALRAFLDAAPDGLRLAFEFRHASWNAPPVRAMLADAGAAWVHAETESSAGSMTDTAPFAYVRLRRDTYDDRAVTEWAGRIDALRDRGDVFCFLRHDEDGANAVAAARLLSLLGEGTGQEATQLAEGGLGRGEQHAAHADRGGALDV